MSDTNFADACVSALSVLPEPAVPGRLHHRLAFVHVWKLLESPKLIFGEQDLLNRKDQKNLSWGPRSLHPPLHYWKNEDVLWPKLDTGTKVRATPNQEKTKEQVFHFGPIRKTGKWST